LLQDSVQSAGCKFALPNLSEAQSFKSTDRFRP
jgi:hypothetical protein